HPLVKRAPVKAPHQTFSQLADLGLRKGVVWVPVVREQATGAPDANERESGATASVSLWHP
ncbi:MAG: hypothetical protein WAQ19_00100, partial [Burkholderiaceae bacterium]